MTESPWINGHACPETTAWRFPVSLVAVVGLRAPAGYFGLELR